MVQMKSFVALIISIYTCHLPFPQIIFKILLIFGAGECKNKVKLYELSFVHFFSSTTKLVSCL